MQSRAKNLILKNTAVLFVGQFATWALTIIYTIYVPRRVGAYGWGELAIAGALTTVGVMIVSLGTGTVLVRDIARDYSKASRMVGAGMVARILLSLPCLLIIGVIALIARYPLHTQIVIYILSIGMIFQLITGPIQSGFMAFEQMKYNSFSSIVSTAMVSFISVGLVLFGRGIILISIVSALASLLVLILNIIWWRPIGGPIRLNLDLKLLRYLVIGGLPFWATGLFLTIYLYIDSLMLSYMTNATVVGWYSVPTKLFGTLLFVPGVVSTAMFPALSRSFKRAPREMVKMARRSFNLLTCISLPLAMGGMILAKPIILQLYGAQFTPSIPIMIVLAATLVPTYLNMLVNQFLIAADRQIVWTKVMAAACVFNPLINLWLISFYQRTHGNGAFGAALALLITEALMTIAGIALLPRGILGWSNVVNMIKSGAAVGLMTLGVWFTRNYFIVIPVTTGTIIFLVAGVALGALPREDLEMVRRVVQNKLLRKLGMKRAAPQPGTKAA